MARLVAALICLVCVAMPAAAAGQSGPGLPAGLAAIRGVAIDAGTGAALPRPRVDMTVARVRVDLVFGGGDGSFEVLAPVKEDVELRFSKAGYAPVTLPLSAEELRDGVAPLRVHMMRGGVITGKVAVAAGMGLGAVILDRVVAVLQGQVMVPVRLRPLEGGGEPATVLPDDNGDFRFGGLPPGRYALSVETGGRGAVTVALPPGGGVHGVGLTLSGPVTPLVTPEPRLLTGPGVVHGRVWTLDGEPARGAQVTARATNGRSFVVSADEAGVFTIRGLPAGSFQIEAYKPGYLRTPHGDRGSGLPPLPVVVRDGVEMSDVDITLPRAAVVTGVVVNEHAEPLEGASVRLLIPSALPGGFTPAPPTGGVSTTDDRGAFRLSGVAPGTYILSAQLPLPNGGYRRQGRRSAYVPAYYPGASDPLGAAWIQVGAGESVTGLTLPMRQVPVVTVAGRALTSDGQPISGVVRLASRALGPNAATARQAKVSSPGTFEFHHVPSGDYTLQAIVTEPAREFAAQAISITDVDPDPVILRTSRGARVRGRIRLEGPVGRPLWGYSVRAVPTEPGAGAPQEMAAAGPMSDGETFLLSALSGPNRLIVWSSDDSWYVKSTRILGIDVTDAPFDFGYDGQDYDLEVEFSSAVASLRGRVTDDRAAPVSHYAVVVFATDSNRWFAGSRWLQIARAGTDGAFHVKAMPPGDYWVAALDRLDGAAPNDWQRADVLQGLIPYATRLSLGAGEQRTTLRLIRR